MLELIKELYQAYKAKKEEEAIKAKLVEADLNYELLEQIINRCKDKELTVRVGNSVIEIKPAKSGTSFKSFKEQFEEAHK